ncbi:hypothetical protein NHX12_007530, partial [Muraenolepis orangiensis]
VHFLMILSANWAYLKDASHMHAYQDIKMKEEQELRDLTRRRDEGVERKVLNVELH